MEFILENEIDKAMEVTIRDAVNNATFRGLARGGHVQALYALYKEHKEHLPFRAFSFIAKGFIQGRQDDAAKLFLQKMEDEGVPGSEIATLESILARKAIKEGYNDHEWILRLSRRALNSYDEFDIYFEALKEKSYRLYKTVCAKEIDLFLAEVKTYSELLPDLRMKAYLELEGFLKSKSITLDALNAFIVNSTLYSSETREQLLRAKSISESELTQILVCKHNLAKDFTKKPLILIENALYGFHNSPSKNSMISIMLEKISIVFPDFIYNLLPDFVNNINPFTLVKILARSSTNPSPELYTCYQKLKNHDSKKLQQEARQFPLSMLHFSQNQIKAWSHADIQATLMAIFSSHDETFKKVFHSSGAHIFTFLLVDLTPEGLSDLMLMRQKKIGVFETVTRDERKFEPAAVSTEPREKFTHGELREILKRHKVNSNNTFFPSEEIKNLKLIAKSGSSHSLVTHDEIKKALGPSDKHRMMLFYGRAKSDLSMTDKIIEEVRDKYYSARRQ